uniref:Rho GTPase-activating protein 26 n=1 Tax=Anoplopoma fimbria TaxID=229290 RepID=C3KHJ3_ANOFI|nr:Rho GTPase-activating protein 26 [Anoplopoma fimbria]
MFLGQVTKVRMQCFIRLNDLIGANKTSVNLTAPYSLLSILSGLSTAKRKFADSLNEFKFQCIGDAETDDEICIGELADMKSNIFPQ